MTMNACMRLRFGAYGLVALAASAGPVLAQAQQYAAAKCRAVELRHCSGSSDSTQRAHLPVCAPLQPRAAKQPAASQQPAPQAPAPPFTLTPQQQAQVDRVLDLWEKHNETIKTFDCYFKRWTYDTIFAKSDKPDEARFVEMGILKYKAPDHGRFCVESAERNGKVEPIGDARAEQWVSDGKSIFEFKYAQKQLIEHVLPPHLQGKAISDTPLPFLFGSEGRSSSSGTGIEDHYARRRHGPDLAAGVSAFSTGGGQLQSGGIPHQCERHDAGGPEPLAAERKGPHNVCVLQRGGKRSFAMPFFHMNPFRPMTPFGWRKIVYSRRLSSRKGNLKPKPANRPCNVVSLGIHSGKIGAMPTLVVGVIRRHPCLLSRCARLAVVQQ